MLITFGFHTDDDDVTCCYLFPKNLAGRPLQLLNEAQDAARRGNGALDPRTKQIIMDRVSKLRNKYGNSVTGRRVDLEVESPISTLPKFIADVTMRHPLTPSNEKTTQRFA